MQAKSHLLQPLYVDLALRLRGVHLCPVHIGKGRQRADLLAVGANQPLVDVALDLFGVDAGLRHVNLSCQRPEPSLVHLRFGLEAFPLSVV